MPVKRYSSGMYVRLAFAVAAHLEPEILVVDEVLAVGDAAFQKKCLGRMSEVSSSGKTVLFVSHHMASISGLCQRGIWLDTGRVVETGTAKHVVDRYLAAQTWNTAQVVDLARQPRQGSFTQSVCLERLEWLTGLPLKHGQECRVRVYFSTLSDAEDVAFGIGFSTMEGLRFLSFDTDFHEERRQLRAGAGGYAELTIAELPVAPGFYTVDVGVRSGDRHVIDLVQAAMQVEILPGLTTPSFIAQYPGVGVRLGGEWDWVCD